MMHGPPAPQGSLTTLGTSATLVLRHVVRPRALWRVPVRARAGAPARAPLRSTLARGRIDRRLDFALFHHRQLALQVRTLVVVLCR